MEKRQKVKPTESELEVLNIIWDRGPSTVREVNDKLNLSKKVGYTTTLKIMQIMTEKELVVRDMQSRTHIYSALVDRSATQEALLDRFLESTFSGSASNLVMQALGNHTTSPDELTLIKELIRKLETTNGDIDK